MVPCPTAEVLGQLLEGLLTEGEGRAVGEHVRACAACQARLDRLTDDSVLRGWEGLRGRTPAEEGLARVLSSLKAGPPPSTVPSLTDSVTPTSSHPADPRAAPMPAPATVGPYAVIEELGRGGMGVVYRAHDPALGRDVAVKVLRPDVTDAAARQRLVREAQAAARCRHDHLVTVFTVVDPPDGQPYLVMEYLGGPTLAARLRGGGPLAPAEAASVAAQVADGLAAAHAAGLIHRDVKPGNVLFDAATGRAKLADFGLARPEEAANLTQTGQAVGTPGYMSPEQAQGQPVTARSDVYSLGVTLYEALTGEAPFRGVPHRVLHQVIHDDPPPPRRLNDKVPRDLETVCLKAMAKEPGRRYASAADFRDDLRRYLKGEPVRARPVRALGRGLRWCRRRPTLTALTAALLLALASGVGGVLWEWRRAEAAASDAREKAARANEERERAEASLRDSLAVVDQYLTTVSEQRLFNEPGFQPLRKELLEKARDFYQRFADEHRDDAHLRRELARAQFRLGNTAYILEGPAGGTAEHEKSVALYEQLAAESPDDLSLRVDLGTAYSNLGMCYENGGRVDDALTTYGRILDICRRAAAGAGEDNFLMLELRTRINRGKALGRKLDWAAEEADLRRAITIAEPLVKAGKQLPDSRRGLAIAYNNLGNLYVALGRSEDAAAAINRAAAAWEAQLRDQPGDLAARHELARTLLNLGSMNLGRSRPDLGEAAYRRAIPVLKELVRDNPAVLEPPVTLAWVLNGRGVAAIMLGRRDEGRAAFREGLDVLKAAPAGSRRLAEEGAAVYLRGNLAHTLSDDGEEEAAAALYAAALDGVAKAFPPGKPSATRSTSLAFLHSRRALHAMRWGHDAEAVADWDRALANNPGPLTGSVRVLRACAAARASGKGSAPGLGPNYAKELLEPAANDAIAFPTGCDLYFTAMEWAVCAARAERDVTIDSAERAKRAEKCAGHAMGYLKRARDAGYFRLPDTAEALRRDHEFDTLRDRADFQALLK